MSRPTHEATIRGRLAGAERLAGETALLQAGWRWERHSFVQRWLSGELSFGDLQAFAAEHHGVVVALADGARRTAAMADGLLAEQLRRYAAEQDRAVELSCAFAVATGWGRSAWFFAQDPLESTAACAHAWSGEGRLLGERLSGLVAIESALGRLAPVLLDALVLRYGLDARGTGYFARRAERSPDDAAVLAAGLTGVLPTAAHTGLLGQAETALRSYWALLDGVEALAMRGA